VSISSDPLELFSLFFDGNVIDLIVMETNRYASQCRGDDDIWETNAEEIRAYFGFYVLMGINHLPEIRDYWSKDEKLHYSPVADRISRRRFEEISRYLHFADNATLPARGEDGYERLQKVQPIITVIRERCLQMFRPLGRSSMKQYLPKKPVKRGFKVWVRADAQTGFFCDFQIYTGKLADGEGVEHGLGERVVLQLSQNIEGRNHQVFCDNFFTTCGLLETLLEKGIYGCGTTKPSRRGFPDDLKKLNLQRGEHAFRQRGNLVATVWKDKKDVTLLSTMTSPDSVTTVQRRQRDGTITDVACPEVVP